MKIFLKGMGYVTTAVGIVYGLLFLMFKEPNPNYMKLGDVQNQTLCLADILPDYSSQDNWKSAVDVAIDFDFSAPKQYYGQKIQFLDGSSDAEIWMGITSYATARVEYWENGVLTKEKEIGFMKKITNLKPLQLFITRTAHETACQKHERYQMRLFEMNGFFGDHAALTEDFPIQKLDTEKICITTFSKGIQSASNNRAKFENHQLWGKYESPD